MRRSPSLLPTTRNGFIAVLVALLCAAAVVRAPVSTAAPEGVAPWNSGDPTFDAPTATPQHVGVVYHGMWADLSDSDRAVYLDRLVAAGVRWVRMDVAWKMIQPTGPGSYDAHGVSMVDKRVGELSSRGIKTLIMLHQAPRWSSGTNARNGRPGNPDDYAKAAAWVAERYAGQVQAIELWNEPNLDYFWAGADVSSFTQLVKASYPRIKAANPAMTVVVGAPTAVDTDWYGQMFQRGLAGNYDALGIHPYIGNTDEPPTECSVQYKKYYPCNIEDLVDLMSANGDGNKEIWATEYGWSTHNSSTYSTPVPHWKRGVTERKQAEYLISMQEVLARWPQVRASFWYTGRNKNMSDAQEKNYGLMHYDFTPKQAYFAMRCAAAGVCGPGAAPAPAPPSPGGTLIGSGSSWRLDDSGADRGSGWRHPDFDDSSWMSGRTEAGFGDGDEVTRLTPGHMTYYARKSFDAGGLAGSATPLRLSAKVDDGAIVYLNGQEVWRRNMPSGSPTSATRAVTYVAGKGETTWVDAQIPATALVAGQNTLAVEIHQHAPHSSDISFDLSLDR